LALEHCCWQSPSAQSPVHVDPDGHTYWQSLRVPEHVSEHAAPAAHVQVGSPESVQAKPVVPEPDDPPSGAVLALPPQPRIKHAQPTKSPQDLRGSRTS
jgi:hypothetical protein